MSPRLFLASSPLFLEHAKPGHPERPERLIEVGRELERTSLLAGFTPLSVREATRDELLLAHEATHVDNVARAVADTPVMLDEDT